jgi:hypothetical protein
VTPCVLLLTLALTPAAAGRHAARKERIHEPISRSQAARISARITGVWEFLYERVVFYF